MTKFVPLDIEETLSTEFLIRPEDDEFDLMELTFFPQSQTLMSHTDHGYNSLDLRPFTFINDLILERAGVLLLILVKL